MDDTSELLERTALEAQGLIDPCRVSHAKVCAKLGVDPLWVSINGRSCPLGEVPCVDRVRQGKGSYMCVRNSENAPTRKEYRCVDNRSCPGKGIRCSPPKGSCGALESLCVELITGVQSCTGRKFKSGRIHRLQPQPKSGLTALCSTKCDKGCRNDELCCTAGESGDICVQPMGQIGDVKNDLNHWKRRVERDRRLESEPCEERGAGPYIVKLLYGKCNKLDSMMCSPTEDAVAGNSFGLSFFCVDINNKLHSIEGEPRMVALEEKSGDSEAPSKVSRNTDEFASLTIFNDPGYTKGTADAAGTINDGASLGTVTSARIRARVIQEIPNLPQMVDAEGVPVTFTLVMVCHAVNKRKCLSNAMPCKVAGAQFCVRNSTNQEDSEKVAACIRQQRECPKHGYVGVCGSTTTCDDGQLLCSGPTDGTPKCVEVPNPNPYFRRSANNGDNFVRMTSANTFRGATPLQLGSDASVFNGLGLPTLLAAILLFYCLSKKLFQI